MRLDIIFAAVTAFVAWGALALQFALLASRMTADGAGLGAAAWRFFGYYTILSNCFIAAVSTAMAFGRPAVLTGPRVKLAAAVTIVVVGVVYSLALRSVWQPTGWQAIADHGLHDVTPVLFMLAWLLSIKQSLLWRDSVWAVAPAVAYCAYAFARGAVDGWYAYWFLDPSTLTLMQLSANIVLLLAVFTVIALAFVALNRRLSQSGKARSPDLPVRS